MKKFGFVLGAAALSALTSLAGEFANGEPKVTPVAVSLLPCDGLQAPGGDWSVAGLRLNLLAGRHQNVLFFSLGGIADLVTKEANGLQFAGFCNHVGSSRGLMQVAGLVNSSDGDFDGLQLAAIYNAVNGRFTGLSVAACSRAETVRGLQVGLFNQAVNMTGLQVGVVNWAENSDGIQLGLVNMMPDGRYPVMPVFNIGF